MKCNFRLLLILIIIFKTSCKSEINKIHNIYTKVESQIILPLRGSFTNFCFFSENNLEYFSYEVNGKIYIICLQTKLLTDSINLFSTSLQREKYGPVNSFCFSGRDSLFVSLENAIIFIDKKIVTKIIPINSLDTIQFKNIRFYNLEDSPIYFDKKKNQVVGEIYFTGSEIFEPAFFRQKILGNISLKTNKLSLYNITYSKTYLNNYYGFGDHVYTYNSDSLVFVSFPFDSNIYQLNRNNDRVLSMHARSNYQKKEFTPLSLDYNNSTEEKMKHLTVNPYYAEVRYDPNRKIVYRFLKTELPLKKANAKYNTFKDKKTILTVINAEGSYLGEYELSNNYSHFVSFLGKAGLYMFAGFANSTVNKKDSAIFKILSFKK